MWVDEPADPYRTPFLRAWSQDPVLGKDLLGSAPRFRPFFPAFGRFSNHGRKVYIIGHFSTP